MIQRRYRIYHAGTMGHQLPVPLHHPYVEGLNVLSAPMNPLSYCRFRIIISSKLIVGAL